MMQGCGAQADRGFAISTHGSIAPGMCVQAGQGEGVFRKLRWAGMVGSTHGFCPHLSDQRLVTWPRFTAGRLGNVA